MAKSKQHDNLYMQARLYSSLSETVRVAALRTDGTQPGVASEGCARRTLDSGNKRNSGSKVPADGRTAVFRDDNWLPLASCCLVVRVLLGQLQVINGVFRDLE